MAAIPLFPYYKATVTTYQHKAVSGLKKQEEQTVRRGERTV
jgi:hypothetical protein